MLFRLFSFQLEQKELVDYVQLLKIDIYDFVVCTQYSKRSEDVSIPPRLVTTAFRTSRWVHGGQSNTCLLLIASVDESLPRLFQGCCSSDTRPPQPIIGRQGRLSGSHISSVPPLPPPPPLSLLQNPGKVQTLGALQAVSVL